MESGERDHGVEADAQRLPGLDRRVDDLDLWEAGELAPRDRGEPLAALDADDLDPALGERNRRLARSTGDLDGAAAVSQPGERDEIVENLG